MSFNFKMNSCIIAIAFLTISVESSPGIPNKIDIKVPCVNATSYCGFNGVCKQSGPVHICKCDNGYSTIDITDPCGAEGQSQTKIAVLTYFFGWTGATCFMLGWTAWGVVILLTCLNGTCCLMHGKENNNPGSTCWGVMCTIAYVVIWFYLAITMSLDNCVDDKGVACKSW